MRARAAVLLLAVAASAAADAVDDALLRARHAEKVEGDLGHALDLYASLLQDRTLDARRQAEIHLRMGMLYERLGQPGEALSHYSAPIYAGPTVPDDVRRRAEESRARLQMLAPKPAAGSAPPPADAAMERRQRFRELLGEARRLKDSGDELRALIRALLALDLDPADPEAKSLAEELQARLGEATRFTRDALRVLQSWTEARTRLVAERGRSLLQEGLEAGRKGKINAAEGAFRAAIGVIDECGFATESEELAALRHRVAEEWRKLRARSMGTSNAEIPVPAAAPPSALRTEFLNLLQRMLDVVSTGEQEYRIFPVAAPAAPARRGWQSKPEDFRLDRSAPSGWTPALFARYHVAARVRPESWAESGSFLEAAGSMLVARNRPETLDALQAELKLIESPPADPVRIRIHLAWVDAAAIAAAGEHLHAWEAGTLGLSPIPYAILSREITADHVAGFLRDRGADVEAPFEVEIDNGAPQTLSLSRAGRAGDLLLDFYPLRDALGRTALALRIASHVPAPPTRTAEREFPRLLAQEGGLFADLAPGRLLLAAGIEDPFATERTGRTLALLWEVLGAPPPAPAEGMGGSGGETSRVEVPLADLLLKVRDDPGPVADSARGFVPRDPQEVFRARGAFLQSLLEDALPAARISVDTSEATAHVAPGVREEAAVVVGSILSESRQTYEVRVRSRLVRTQVFERYLERERPVLYAVEGAAFALLDSPTTESAMAPLAGEPADGVFTRDEEFPAVSCLGTQERHLLSARILTVPAWADAQDLAGGAARTLMEGLRVSVRPYRWRGNLWAEVEIQTSVLEGVEEELALEGPVPSYRPRTGGTRVAGRIDLGPAGGPRTLLFSRIQPPGRSTPDHLCELVVAVCIRAIGS